MAEGSAKLGARADLVAEVASYVPAAVGADCVRVGVDGVDGAGKTFFAAELASALRDRGRPVVEFSVDGWHRVRAERYARGPQSPVGFWLDSYDYPRLIDEALTPLGPRGSRRFRTAGHDVRTDELLWPDLVEAPAASVVVIDGLFLHRAELEGCFEFTVFVDVPFEVTAERMAVRDGARGDPAHPAMRRYVEAQRTYFAERAPWSRADLVVDNTDLVNPVLVTGRLD
ncbi:uridine kinase [Pedococcus bigeumensis]|uniref:Uridine kinase n=1 Tax=Pedococcus bigeumensis TaxID=433644 RepID=A0A502CVM7_9MICO|nr:uridine kinase [Pedococcus bigeumensis]TPG17297.1 uridine kinase [Pedococcus bigeumensis]